MQRLAAYLIRRIPERLRARIWSRRARSLSGTDYWNERALFFGAQAVLNLAHTGDEAAAVTAMQEQAIFPAITPYLRGDEGKTLDFGCGPGRFMPSLLRHFCGIIIAADPVKMLLSKVPANERIRLVRIGDGALPFADGSIDVVWVCLVLGGIEPARIGQTADELQRVLKQDGTLILVENTARLQSSRHWHFRLVAEYQKLFSGVELVQVAGYMDAGEPISVMAGRKTVIQELNPVGMGV